MTDTVIRELQLDLTIAEAWPLISDAECLTGWLADQARLELAPGGEACFVINGAPRSGWIEEVQPPGEGDHAWVAFWWQSGDEPASRVVLELAGRPNGTRLRISETRPLEVLDLIGIPLRGLGGRAHGPALLVG